MEEAVGPMLTEGIFSLYNDMKVFQDSVVSIWPTNVTFNLDSSSYECCHALQRCCAPNRLSV